MQLALGYTYIDIDSFIHSVILL